MMIKCVRNMAAVVVFASFLSPFHVSFAQQFVDSGLTLPGLYAGSAHWGDFDGGSSPGLLLTGKDDSGEPVTLIYQNSGGNLTQIIHSVTGVYFGEGLWVDYDNDGDLDIFVIGLDGDDNSVAEIWKNTNGTFTLDANQNLTGLRYASAAWGDYNNDGLSDLITTGMDRFGESRTILYKNVLEGLKYLLIEEENQPLLDISKGAVAFGDFDNDGDLDLVMSGMDAGGFPNAAFYKNDPVGFFSYDNQNSPNIRKLSSGSLSWGDADEDGFFDLLQTGLSSDWQAVTTLYENEHNATLGGNILTSATGIAGNAAWGDFDNDGTVDIALTGKDTYSNLFGNILTRNQNGSFTELQGKFAGLRDGAIAAADYDGDRKLDLLISGIDDTGHAKTVLYRNTTPVAAVIPQPPQFLHSVIVTNDQINLSWDKGSDDLTPDDILTYNLRIGVQGQPNSVVSSAIPVGNGNVGNRVNIFLKIQLPEGTYTWSVQTVNSQYLRSAWSQEGIFSVEQFVSSVQNIAGFQFAASAWGDYDGDGDPDLVVAGTDVNGNNRTVLYTNEDGVLTEDRTVNNNLVKFNQGDLAWGDYDNDGDLDLAYTGFFVRESATSGLYINDNGVLTEIQGAFTSVGFASLDWGDYDNDGDLDLAVMGKTTAGPFITKIFRNEDGNLSEDTNQSLVGYANGSLKWVDYDNDGDLDLSMTGQSANFDNKVRIYRNDPPGVLTEAPFDLPSFQSSDLVWSDIDDDGDVDLIVTGFYQNSTLNTVVIRNFPTGNLTENATLSANLQGVVGGSLSAGDYDNDGDPDLVITGFDFVSPTVKLYKNNTTAFNEEILSILQNKGVDFSSASLIDIDADGDLELITIGRTKFNETTFSAVSTVYDNVSSRSNPNTAPQEVQSLQASVSGENVTLSWEPAVDFPIGDPLRDSLTYQIRVGTVPGGSEIVSGAQPPEIGKFGSTTRRTVTGLTSGDYFWSVRAIDNGLAPSAWALDNTFRIDTSPPSVGSDSVEITPDSVGVGNVTVFISATENFDLDNSVEPSVTVLLPDGNEVPVFMLSYSGKAWIGELTIREDYPSGTAFLNVSGITDAAGNMMVPVTQVKHFYLDTERPRVVATNPPFAENAVQEGILRNITLSASFSEQIAPASVSNNILKLFRGAEEVEKASGVQLSGDRMSISALYSNLLSETEYRAVVVARIRDRVGNTLDGDFSWQFKTARVVSAQSGGSVSTADSSVVLNLSPNAVDADIEITIEKITPVILPADLTFINVAFQIGPESGLVLNKPAQIKMRYSETDLTPGISRTTGQPSLQKYSRQQIEEDKLALFRQSPANPADWEKLGGTIDASTHTISASTTKLGTFGIFEDLSPAAGSATVTDISIEPRVFAPSGSGTLPPVASINFELGTPMNVTILIFNVSGRPVRKLVENRPLNAGVNSVDWDGKDGDGRILPSGLYIVALNSGGMTKTKTVAISNR